MEEITKLLTKIELTADEIIDTRQQILSLDAKRHKVREALNRLRDLRSTKPKVAKQNWVCLGDMFIRLDSNNARNLIFDEQYHLDQGVEKLRDELSTKVDKLNELEGKPERAGFGLKPLNRKEIEALRAGFKL